MGSEENRELFARVVQAGGRTYYFDVKVSSEGKKYLVISEVVRHAGSQERHRVMIFEEHLPECMHALWLAWRAIFPGQIPEGQLSRETDKILYTRAYLPWSSEEDARLLEQFEAGTPIAQIAASHQRRPSAIRTRLKKLGAI